MYTITSVDENGIIRERLYDHRRCNFFSMDGDKIDMQFKAANNPRSGKKINKTNDAQQVSQTNNSQQTNAGASGEEKKDACKPGCTCGSDKPKKVLTEAEQLERKKKYGNRLSQDVKSTNPRTLKIQLGLGCNYSCSYCKQAHHVDSAEKTNMQDVEEFITNFDTWCTVPREDEIKIELWGGEPLVYFAKIKKLVPFLRGRFDKARISFLSNGELFNEEVCNYVLENNISFAISHDGPGHLKHRTSDPLREGSESLKWLKHYISVTKNPLYVNMVLTKQNHNPSEGVKYIKSILGDTVQAGYEGIVVVEDESQFTEDMVFTEEDYLNFRELVKSQYMSGELRSISPFNGRLDNIVSSWVNNNFVVSDNGLQKCGHDNPWLLSVDLKGNALVCHSSSNRIGSIYDFSNIDLKKAGITRWTEREHCKDCVVLSVCNGGCMDIPDGNERTLSCNNEYNLYMAIFESAFMYIFGETIIQISGEYTRPELVEKSKTIMLTEVK